jgi:hypothetical protein
MNMHISTETITPTTAAAYLERNTGNRALKSKHVEALANAMTDGHWQCTHEGIAFAVDGSLIDGQHRLAAVVKSGVTITSLVFRDCDAGTFHVIGDASRRSAADVLHLSGEVSTTKLAAATNYAIVGDAARHASKTEISKFVASKHGDLLRKMITGDSVPSPIVGALSRAVRAAVINEADALKFCDEYRRGSWDGPDSPVCILRLSNDRNSRRGRVQYPYAVRAIMMMANGERALKLYAAGEDFKPLA